MKPANILVNLEGELKIADFGLAIGTVGESHTLISYVVTRPYRAPELLLDNRHYTSAVDMWSFGCIVAEMLLRKPLFKASSTREQMNCIMEAIGKPNQQDTRQIAHPRYLTMVSNFPAAEPKPWSELLPESPEDLVDLVAELLYFAPSARRTATECLRHIAFEALHLPSDEPECPQKFKFVTEDCEIYDVHALIQQVAHDTEEAIRAPRPMAKPAGAEAEEDDFLLPTDPFAEVMDDIYFKKLKEEQERELFSVTDDHDAYMASLKDIFEF